jgi:hypothetical protein
VHPLVAELEESNALALAIVAPGMYRIVDTLNTKLSRLALNVHDVK